MFTFKELFEAKDAGGHGSEKRHVMSFARMNPPTTGHMEVIKKLHDVADQHKAGHSLIVSHSQDAKKNPLSSEQKIKHIKRYSPETNVKAASKEAPTILHHAAELHKSGVQHLHVVAGSDRHKEMHDLLNKYNTGEEHKHGSFKFKSITMHSSGERDPDSEGTTGMSGTKMREHAHSGNFAEFRKGVPSHVSDKHAHELMKDVRQGSGIKEQQISYKELMEVRMSAAVKLQRAFEREQQKSAASRERAKQLLAPKKPEPVKEETIDETIVKVDSGYEVHSEKGKNLGGSPTLAGAKKRLRQVEYFKHVKEEIQLEDFEDKNLAKQELSNKKNKGGVRGNVIAALRRKAGLTESVHDNRTGFAKKKREDDEGGELYRHTYKYTVSKPGVNNGEKHERHVTTPLTPRKKTEIEHLARAHITKQGYQIHEESMAEEEKRGAYKQKSPVVIAPKDPKAKTYGKIVSKLRTMGEEINLDESMTDSWKSVQSMDKGSVTGDKHEVKKRLAYLNAVHAHHKKFGNDTHKVRKEIEGINRSRITEETAGETYEDAQKHKELADEHAEEHGKDSSHYHHAMANHHEAMGRWHESKGRNSIADKEFNKADSHHEQGVAAATSKNEELEEATPYYNKPSFLKNMGRIAKQERLAREKKEAEAKQKPVKEQFDQEFNVLEEAAKSIDKGEYDYEGQMARTQLQTTLRNCTDLIDMIEDDDNMPEWVQSKITLAQDYITTVRDYLQSKEELEEGASGYQPGWMLRQDPALAKKLKDQLARKKFVAGEPTKKNVKEETQEKLMGLKSFITLVKEGTMQSSGDDSIPTLTKAPQAPTLDRKYIKGTPEHKAYKATKKPINGHPTGKYNEEVDQVDEALRPGFTHHDAAEAQRRREETLKNNPKIAAEVERRKAAEASKAKSVQEETEEVDEGLDSVRDKVRKQYYGDNGDQAANRARRREAEADAAHARMVNFHGNRSKEDDSNTAHHIATHELNRQHRADAGDEHKKNMEVMRNRLKKEEFDLAEKLNVGGGPARRETTSTGGTIVTNSPVKKPAEKPEPRKSNQVSSAMGRLRAKMNVKEEVEELDEKSEQAKRNKTMKNMMDASRGARFKVNNPQSMTPKPDTGHKTPQDHNKAIGRALRNEDADLDEASAPVAPTNKKPAIDIDKVHTAGDAPHHETFENHKKVKKESFSVADLFQALKEGMWPGTPEYKAKYDGAKQGGGSGIKKGSRYGGSLQKDEPEHDEEPATAGRKVGSKSGARKNLGNSKLHK
jgi:hypothetical protein